MEYHIRLVGAFSTAFITLSGVRKIYVDAVGDTGRKPFTEVVGREVPRIM